MRVSDAIHEAELNDPFITPDEFDSIYAAIDEERGEVPYRAGNAEAFNLTIQREIGPQHFRSPAEFNSFYDNYAARYWSRRGEQAREIFFTRLRERLETVQVRTRHDLLDFISDNFGSMQFVSQEHETFFRRQDSCGSNALPTASSMLSSPGGFGMGVFGLTMGRGSSCLSASNPDTEEFFSAVLNSFPSSSLTNQGVEINIGNLQAPQAHRILISLQSIREALRNSVHDFPRHILRPNVVLRPFTALHVPFYAAPRESESAAYFSAGVDANLVLGGRVYSDPLTPQLSTDRFFIAGGYQYVYGMNPVLPAHQVRFGAGFRYENFHHFENRQPSLSLQVGLLGTVGLGGQNSTYGGLLNFTAEFNLNSILGFGLMADLGGNTESAVMNLAAFGSVRF